MGNEFFPWKISSGHTLGTYEAHGRINKISNVQLHNFREAVSKQGTRTIATEVCVCGLVACTALPTVFPSLPSAMSTRQLGGWTVRMVGHAFIRVAQRIGPNAAVRKTLVWPRYVVKRSAVISTEVMWRLVLLPTMLPSLVWAVVRRVTQVWAGTARVGTTAFRVLVAVQVLYKEVN